MKIIFLISLHFANLAIYSSAGSIVAKEYDKKIRCKVRQKIPKETPKEA